MFQGLAHLWPFAADAEGSDSAGLDVTPITERVVAMGRPWRHRTEKMSNRNNVQQLAAFLAERYTNVLVVNLEPMEAQYDFRLFKNQVLEFDVATTPCLRRLFEVVTALRDWLTLSSGNTLAIHCHNGKSRTGLVVACLLVLQQTCDNALDALDTFATKRQLEPGWVLKTHRRFLDYFYDVVMFGGVVPNVTPLILSRLILHTASPMTGSSYTPVLTIWADGHAVFSSQYADSREQQEHVIVDDFTIAFVVDVELLGSFELHYSLTLDSGADTTVFRCGFHTGFLPPGVFRVDNGHLDARDNAAFRIEAIDLVFAESQAASEDYPLETFAPIDLSPPLDQCMEVLSTLHVVTPQGSLVEGLSQSGFDQRMAVFCLQCCQNDMLEAHQMCASLVQLFSERKAEAAALGAPQATVRLNDEPGQGVGGAATAEPQQAIQLARQQLLEQARSRLSKFRKRKKGARPRLLEVALLSGGQDGGDSSGAEFDDADGGDRGAEQAVASDTQGPAGAEDEPEEDQECTQPLCAEIGTCVCSSSTPQSPKRPQSACSSDDGQAAVAVAVVAGTSRTMSAACSSSSLRRIEEQEEQGSRKQTADEGGSLMQRRPGPVETGNAVACASGAMPGGHGVPPPPHAMGFPPPPGLAIPGTQHVGPGPPAPPPPPDGFMFPGGAAAAHDPNRKTVTRKLHWNTVPMHLLTNTIWTDVQADGEARSSVDVEEFEELFCAEPGQQPQVAKKSAKKKAAATLLDLRRSNNVNIGLTRFLKKLGSLQELVDTVLQFDASELTLDDLHTLKRILPTDDEAKKAATYRGDQSILSPAERFFWVCGQSGCQVDAVCDCFVFTLEFSEKLQFVLETLGCIQAACAELQESKSLKHLLRLTLDLGNLTNVEYAPTTARGMAARGVTVDSLTKLRDVKAAKDSKTTLMSFLIKTVKEKQPDALNVLDELSHLEQARHCDLSLAESEIESLHQGVQNVRSQLRAKMPEATLTRMREFVDEAQGKLQGADAQLAQAKSDVAACVSYFGEPASMAPAELFAQLHGFVQAFQDARTEHRQ